MSQSYNRFTTIVIVLLVIALAAGAVILRKHRTSQVTSLPNIEPVPWALHSITIHKGHLSQEFLALATLNGSTEITISSQISGEIEQMGPREGIKVKKGDLLAKISVSELTEQRAGLEAQLEAAEAELSRSKDEFARQKQLIKKHLTSQELYDAKKTAALSANKQVSNLQRQISALNVRIGYGSVYAPVDALVASRLSEPGDIALPGKVLYKLTIDTTSRLQVKLPQQVLEQVHPGSKVLLSYGSLQQVVHLSRIFPALDTHALGTAEADLNSMPFGLPSGSRIPAHVILTSVNDALIIPHRAIVESGTDENTGDKIKKGFVFKIVTDDQHKNKRLKRIEVEIILNAHKALAIRSNELHEGDQLVVAHESVLLQLKNNDPVITKNISQSVTGVSQ